MPVTDLTIDQDIVINAPADVVWRTITRPDQIELWFADRVELDLRPGGRGTLTFDDKASARTVTAPVVVEVVEPVRSFAFRWSHPDGEEPSPRNSVLVTFTLEPVGAEQTRLRVVETGLDGVDWSEEQKVSYADDHRHGWSVHMERIGELLGVASE